MRDLVDSLNTRDRIKKRCGDKEGKRTATLPTQNVAFSASIAVDVRVVVVVVMDVVVIVALAIAREISKI